MSQKNDLAEVIEKQVNEAVEVIRKAVDMTPDFGIILGTGLGGLKKEIKNQTVLNYLEIPHFPVSTFSAHAGELVFGELEGKNVVAMVGRFHRYEGYDLKQVTFPVRVMKALGARAMLVSNAGGGMRPVHLPGDLMIIEDHVNLFGDNPLIGINSNRLGPRFPDMVEPYDRKMISLAREIAREEGITAHVGVYVGVTGPCLETRAEYRFLRIIGCDVVGMSTVPEVIVAVQCGLKVLGVSVITDKCIPDALQPADIEEIIATGNKAEPRLTKLFCRVIKEYDF